MQWRLQYCSVMDGLSLLAKVCMYSIVYMHVVFAFVSKQIPLILALTDQHSSGGSLTDHAFTGRQRTRGSLTAHGFTVRQGTSGVLADHVLPSGMVSSELGDSSGGIITRTGCLGGGNRGSRIDAHLAATGFAQISGNAANGGWGLGGRGHGGECGIIFGVLDTFIFVMGA